jgi:diaminopimelate decarboxylase
LPIADIAEQHGTPCYLYDADVLRDTVRSVLERLHAPLEVFYSLKANPNISVCAVLHAHGARAEVSSLAELVTALRAGVAPGDIIFLGPGKSADEIKACLDAGIYTIVCESLGELELLEVLARQHGTSARVTLRINPSFQVKGSGLTMGGKPRQFGIDEEQLPQLAPVLARCTRLRVIGVQVYLGTRILDADAVVDNTARILALAPTVAGALGFDLEFVDIGGGLGVAYFPGEADLDLDRLAAGMNPLIDAFRAAHPHTRLGMELGRYLTALAGTYVTRVRYTKTSVGERFAVTDGGTNHHMAAVGIGSFVKRNFPLQLLSRDSAEPDEAWNVTGPLCTPNDTLGKKVALPPLRVGDLVGVLRSGAYGPTASPGLFLSHGYPAELMVLDGRVHVVRERDDTTALLRAQRLVDLTTATSPH